MSKIKTKHIIAGRLRGLAIVINTDTMRYLWCHRNAMESVVLLDSGDLTIGCPVGDNFELLLGFINDDSIRILI